MVADLRVAVVGGGIGGLAATLAFYRRGIEVRCFEQAGVLAEVGAGLMLAPNGVRALRHLGVGDVVDRLGGPITDMIISGADGTEVARVDRRTPGGSERYLGIHRADLFELLASELPDDIVVAGHRCVQFEQEPERATVCFANGASYDADVVIAADGIHSFLQRYVVSPAKPVHSGTTAYRGTLPSSEVDWPPGRFQIWMGLGKHFIAYPLRAGELVNYVGFVTTADKARESWSAHGDLRELAAAFAGWDETVKRIIDRIGDTFAWGLYDREPLSRWTAGRLALLGDAAHPMLPHAGQGANQALEDAVTVAALVARAHRADVPRALQHYVNLRRPRTTEIQRNSRSNGNRFDSDEGHIEARDRSISSGPGDTSWIDDHDAVAHAEAYADALD
ncbi:FAD-dependent monooxygenase [Mycobacterium sp. SMC-2]|uniref:FAD-dependent monooxygenase n=1 Tax=Mycobacterium sp. SMC-2 TaxID=2857058 RepID=UPI0021B17A6B|nr:FAD-dependent monooxygenase [Mycobacterium sp. SMC-2]UXA05386.1 FAD-dependent monooxygenase [Mycobacterium sp. SMC-2]